MLSSQYIKYSILGLSSISLFSTFLLNYYRRNQKYPYTYRAKDHKVYKSLTYKNVVIEEPYKWLEDPDSKDTMNWVEKQNNITDRYLESCIYKEKIETELINLNNYEKLSCPFKQNNKYYYFYNSGLLNHSILKQRSTIDGEDITIVDPNTWSTDGTTSLSSYKFSKKSNYLAYGVSVSGSDWVTINILNINNLELLNEKIEWVKFSGISWLNDDGFFYSRYPVQEDLVDKGKEITSAANHSLYYHKLGTNQSEDCLIYSSPENPEWNFGGEVTEDCKYLMITATSGCDPKNRVFFTDLSKCDFSSKKLDSSLIMKAIDNFDGGYDYITNKGTVFYFKTNLNAPKSKVVSLDLSNYKEGVDLSSTLQIVLAEVEGNDGVLESVYCVAKNKLLVCSTENVQNVLRLYDFTLNTSTLVHTFELPCPGTISGIGAREEDDEFFFSFTSFIYPSVIYHVNLFGNRKLDVMQKVWREIKANNMDSSIFKVEQKFYSSKDGTKVPMFIISRKDIVYDGNNPCILYGYGGFDISLLPGFAASRLVWVKNFHAAYVIANIRGGGEFGTNWHNGGKLLNKQNVFDDFQYAAKHLSTIGVTKPSKLAINGGSNGGLLVGACINQAPELFGAAVGQVGVMDMLNFHRFTIGHAWKTDYGNPDEPEMFDYLRKYSPLHNINETKPYPSVLLTTADHDDRVVPSHSYKYIAELQYRIGEREYQKNPLLIKVETKAGHGAGKPLKKAIAEAAVNYAFIAKATDAVWNN